MKRGNIIFSKINCAIFGNYCNSIFYLTSCYHNFPNVKNFIANDIPDFSYADGILDVKSDDTVTIDNIADQVLIIADTKD